MDLEDLRTVDRRTWRKYLFYTDLAVIAVFCISLVLVVRHTFQAGQWYEQGRFDLATAGLWLVVADTAFLVASLSWIFYRFFRNQYLVLTRRF